MARRLPLVRPGEAVDRLWPTLAVARLQATHLEEDGWEVERHDPPLEVPGVPLVRVVATVRHPDSRQRVGGVSYRHAGA